MLLLEKYWNKQTFDVAGGIIVFVPARNQVFVTGSQDAEGMRIAQALGKEGYKEPGYAISPRGTAKRLARGRHTPANRHRHKAIVTR